MDDVTDQSWRTSALCLAADPVLFHPDKGQPTSPAQRLCRQCPVQPDCLDYALATRQQFGVWGGLSTTQRQPLLQAAS